MTELVHNRVPPQPLNLRGRAMLLIRVTQPTDEFLLEMITVVPSAGRRCKTQRRVNDTKVCEDETAMWMAIRDLASGRLVDMAEMMMEPPEVTTEATRAAE